MAATFEVMCLGTGQKIDTIKSNVASENDSAPDGMTFGSAGTPLAYSAQHTFWPMSSTGGTVDRHNIDNKLLLLFPGTALIAYRKKDAKIAA